MTFNNEYEVRDWLVELIESRGWKVQKEIPTDETREHKNPEKIDLIIFKSKYPELDPIGIELKFMRGSLRGTIISEAMDQLLFKYVPSHFNGKKLKTICIGLYVARESSADTHTFTRGFLNYWGIGYINLNDPHVRIQFGEINQKDEILYIQYASFKRFSEYCIEQEKRYSVDPQRIQESNKWRKFQKKL